MELWMANLSNANQRPTESRSNVPTTSRTLYIARWPEVKVADEVDGEETETPITVSALILDITDRGCCCCCCCSYSQACLCSAVNEEAEDGEDGEGD